MSRCFSSLVRLAIDAPARQLCCGSGSVSSFSFSFNINMCPSLCCLFLNPSAIVSLRNNSRTTRSCEARGHNPNPIPNPNPNEQMCARIKYSFFYFPPLPAFHLPSAPIYLLTTNEQTQTCSRTTRTIYTTGRAVRIRACRRCSGRGARALIENGRMDVGNERRQCLDKQTRNTS